MEIKSIQLKSNCIVYGPPPAAEDEVEQRLTVAADGHVWFSARNYEQYLAEKGFCRREQTGIGAARAQELLRMLEEMPEAMMVTDCGYWYLEIRYADGSRRQTRGSMIGNAVVRTPDGAEAPAAEVLREYVPVRGLRGFD